MDHFLQNDDNPVWLSQLGSIVQALMLAGTAICAYVVSVLSFEAMGLGRENAWIALASFGGFFALNILITFLHEMGHALAGWASGHRVHMICVGWVGYAPETRRFMRIADPGGQGEYAGFVHATPIYPDFSARKALALSLGGPLMTGGIGALILLLNGAAGEWRFAVIGIGAAFILDMVANLIPLQWRSGQGSDGLNVIGHLRGQSWSRTDWAANRIAARRHSRSLVSADEWEALRPLAISRERHNGPFHDFLRRCAWEHYDLPAYYALIKSSGVMLAQLTSDAACHFIIAGLAASRRTIDTRAAERALAAMPDSFVQTSADYWQARAALDHAQGRTEAARKASRQALFIADQMGQTLPEARHYALAALTQIEDAAA